MAIVKSIYRYPGAKARLLNVIMPEINKIISGKDYFADCFVGGGSVTIEVAKQHKNLHIYVNDKNYNIYSFWKILSEDNLSAVLELNNLLNIKPTVDLFYNLKSENATDLVRSAYKGIFLNRCSFSGMGINPIGGKDQKSKYKVDCRFNSEKLKNTILELHKLLKNRMTASNCDINDYSILLDDSIPAYLDPPYYQVGKDLYNVYMSHDEHAKLSNILNQRGDWVLSYDDDSNIKKFYNSKKITNISAKYSINGIKTNWAEKQELLITP